MGKPNIVLVVLDSSRAQNLPFYGYERGTAPFLTEMAERHLEISNQEDVVYRGEDSEEMREELRSHDFVGKILAGRAAVERSVEDKKIKKWLEKLGYR
ncbi:MAG: hypothetical protein SVS85_02690 [Candidatus Nanohaloarchaea archaeon]|nr:hypothetical protein [Candidatus Nanohaloarchaea archaeon]